MNVSAPRWIGLLALCFALLGCGGESTTEPGDSTKPAEQAIDPTLAMVLEVSEPTYWRAGEELSTIDDVRLLALSSQTKIDQGYTLSIDASHERAGQVRLLLERTSEQDDEIDLSAESDKLFEQVKQIFDEQAKQSLVEALAHQQALAKTASQAVTALQRKLQAYQESQHGLPATSESRLERRKLDRQIKTTLQGRIDADKRIEELQRRIDRERYVTLLRVR